MALVTRDVAHGCVWVVALWCILCGVGLAHGVATTPVLLLFRELNTVTVYDKAAVCIKAVKLWWMTLKGQEGRTEVDQEGDGVRNNEANTAPVENIGTCI